MRLSDAKTARKKQAPLTLMSLTLQFVLELAALAAFGYGGYSIGNDIAASFVLAVAASLIAAAIWGFFGSPRARVQLGPRLGLLFRAVFFGSAAVALAATGASRPALVFAVLVVANSAVLIAMESE